MKEIKIKKSLKSDIIWILIANLSWVIFMFLLLVLWHILRLLITSDIYSNLCKATNLKAAVCDGIFLHLLPLGIFAILLGYLIAKKLTFKSFNKIIIYNVFLVPIPTFLLFSILMIGLSVPVDIIRDISNLKFLLWHLPAMLYFISLNIFLIKRWWYSSKKK